MNPGWNILCDFDGTIALDDVTDTLLERFARPGWELIEAAWKAGRIGSRECMSGQIALIDADRDEVDAVLDGLRIDPGFHDFVRASQRAGIGMSVVSDGLDYAIHRILGRHGLDGLPVIANRLLQTAPREWRIEFPHAGTQCRSGTCKCSCARRETAARKRVLLIGDGQSDFCVATEADFVFAKGKLIEHCRQNHIPHAPIGGFLEALALLPSLLDGLFEAQTQRAERLLNTRVRTP
ncbi:MtnX-like HAD-IB family phosphatase [Lysobacter capsici]|uniref:MtnX-like HAD-IB family phosphatase n=1 Tax=Lysobacter capsici TaxID=435897 RepID=UPI001C0040CD|nr:MtnX-like HAD-IB family phosphatase [Lysobacter capsici]QWF17531.1 MtnX-like HAD-IB family phosphatase [Lysobacter capsici]